MRRLFALLCLASIGTLAFPQTGLSVVKAYLDGDGWVHIVTKDGRGCIIKPAKWQASGGFGPPVVAADGRTVGWLANQMLTTLEGGTDYPYPVALELDIWRDGRVIRKFSPSALTIRNWIFLQNGSEVAFHMAPPRGQEFYVCELFDIGTGKKIAEWSLDRRDYVVPDWAKLLLADETLPGPGEISNWLPDPPAPAKDTAHQRSR